MERSKSAGIALILVLSLLVAQNGWGMQGAKKPTGKPYAEGELLVKFKAGVSEAAIQEVFRQNGTEVIRFLGSLKIYVLRLPPGTAVEGAVKKFRSLPEVEFAEPNYAVTLQTPQKD